MSHQNPDPASPLDDHDDLLRAPDAHHAEQEDGAPVRTKAHHSESSAPGDQAGEGSSETYSVWPQVEGVDPFRRTPPLYVRDPVEPAPRRCAGAPQSAPSEKSVELSEKQRRAIELLIAGKAYTRIAKRLGIDRGTLWRWRNRDANFRRALENAREDAYRDADSRLRELVPRALEVLASHLDKDDYQTAVRVLRMARVDGQQALEAYESRPFLLGGRL